MEKNWSWFWFNGRLEVMVMFDLRDWGILAAAGWHDSQLNVRAQVGPFEVHVDADFSGYVEDIEFFDEDDEV